MKRLVLMMMFVCLSVNGFASEGSVKQRETLKEKIIGTFVKTFAKTYIATHNLEKFKQKNIKKLIKMDEAKFQRVYKRIYHEMMVDLPHALKEQYGVTKEMTRAKAIERINAFRNKRQIYTMINAIPNTMIARHFKKHKKEFKRAMKKDSGVDGLVDEMLKDPGVSS